MASSSISANSPEVYTTGYGFDTFGRLMTLTLPDGEILTHRYDSGGNINRIEGDRPAKSGSGAEHTDYLQSLLYDQFEQRTLVKLGNGIETRYTYQADNRRLGNLQSTGNLAGKFQNLAYKYDPVGNITSLTNDVAIAPANTFGGPTRHSYGYDDLYRLTSAGGSFTQSPGKERRYTLAMQYDAVHNIVNKTQTDTLTSNNNPGIAQKGTTYDWAYAYQGSQPHAPTHIGDRTFYYDANGNQTGYVSDRNGTKRTIVWDEDNRIQSIADNGSTTDDQYDDQGQRIVKTGKQGETVYVNQFYTVRNRSIVSKHVFAGTSRLATKLVGGNGNTSVPPASPTIASATSSLTSAPQITSPDGSASTTATVQDLAGSAIAIPATANAGTANPVTPVAAAEGKNNTLSVEGEEQGKGKKRGNAQGQANKLADGAQQTAALPGNSQAALEHALASGQGNKTGIYQRLDRLGYQVDAGGRIVPRDGSGTGGTPGTIQAPQNFLYFYHPDHLGSTGYVTDASGKLYEHIEYFPFGETWVQEHSNTQRTPYLFTGKELDEETGLYYFGARYYDPRTSVWQSPDPILGKYLDGKHNGGVFNATHLALYSYVVNNPVLLIDPNGLAEILFANKADGSVITDHSKKVISDKADAAKISSVTVSSIERSAVDQRNSMYKTIEADGVDATKAVYGNAGDKVVDAYAVAKKAEKSVDEIKKAMLDQLNLEPTSNHMNQDKSKRQVIDIAPSSIPSRKADEWKKQIQSGGEINKVILPGAGERAYHLEINQPPPPPAQPQP
jgi:RHS repeat-associated protein